MHRFIPATPPRLPRGPPLAAGASLVPAIGCNSFAALSSSAPDTFSCDRRRATSQGTVTIH